MTNTRLEIMNLNSRGFMKHIVRVEHETYKIILQMIRLCEE